MGEEDEKPPAASSRGVKWRLEDLEGQQAQPTTVTRPGLQRARSHGSLSIHSIRSNSGVDPAAALPIQYRTVSIDIDDYNRKAELAKKVQKDTTTDLADLEWHTISTDETIRRLSTSATQGLSHDQIKRRTEQYGKNMPAPPETHRFKQWFGYFFKGFGSILFVGAILVFIAWRPLGDPPVLANLALAIVLVAVFVLQAGFNVWQDWSTQKVMASIKNMIPEECLAIRDGAQVSLMAADIVPGDVLLIKAGNKLPADVRFVQVSSDAKFDRSILTGESVPLGATVDYTDKNYLETKNIGLQGTHCASGLCTGIVVATAGRTVFGRIAKLTNEPKKGLTPIEREVLNFVWIIVSIMVTVIVAVVSIWAGWLRKAHPGWISVPNLIISCVSVAIAFIPEGLPIATTASLTIAANMMKKNKILCKSLKTVETLGTVSVICSDKTGTLTENKMVVTDCAVGLKTMEADAARDVVAAARTKEGHHASSAIDQLRSVAGLCNAGEFDATTNHLPLANRKIHGDATDQAILRFAESMGPVAELKRFWATKFNLAFNSKNKFMIRVLGSTHPDGLGVALPTGTAAIFEPGDLLLTIKGAPEILLNRCSNYTSSSGIPVPLNAAARASIDKIKNDWSAQGRRVLLLAHKAISRSALKSTPSSTAFETEMLQQAKTGLTVVGLVAIIDPPRPEIPEVSKILRGAGIRIFMVTGDFALTAQAIARDCGIITNPPHLIDNVSALSREPLEKAYKEEGADTPSDEDDDTTITPTNPRSIIITGPDLLTLNTTQWDQLATYHEIVFARTTPEQKLRIVRELQSRAQVVGMTGDGANDAPALRAADIGIAIGGGSDIAIEAADMVLLESFSSIVEAVRFGRVLFDNLKKTIAYLLPAGSFSEFWPVMTNVAFGLPQVLSSFLMIVICCLTDCMAATALAYEAPEADVLLRPPRRIGVDRLVDWKFILQTYGFIGMLETFASFAMSYWYLQRNGIPFDKIWFSFGTPEGIDPEYYAQKLNEASSIYFVTLVVIQWFNLLGCRTRRLSIFQHPPLFNKATRNYWLFPAMLFALVMAFFWLYVPTFQEVLDTAAVPVEHWFLPMALGMGILLLDEARKFCVRTYPKGLLARIAW